MNSVKSVAENTLISIPTFSELPRTRRAPGTFVKISRQSAFALSLVLLMALVGPTQKRPGEQGHPEPGPDTTGTQHCGVGHPKLALCHSRLRRPEIRGPETDQRR